MSFDHPLQITHSICVILAQYHWWHKESLIFQRYSMAHCGWFFFLHMRYPVLNKSRVYSQIWHFWNTDWSQIDARLFQQYFLTLKGRSLFHEIVTAFAFTYSQEWNKICPFSDKYADESNILMPIPEMKPTAVTTSYKQAPLGCSKIIDYKFRYRYTKLL